ncbi:hypothetical protein D3C76_1844100 [compost metagenome]
MRLSFGNRIFAVERQFSELNIPIAQVIPDEVVQLPACLPKFISINQAGNVAGRLIEAVENPAVGS